MTMAGSRAAAWSGRRCNALLADIRSGRIDIVVVYKVDRLTRSLADFARLVEIFDAQGVSFVSVTQQFNTTSSMGRLTLNVLLSFAQFEREVTGERIRDKIAASKKKGMWMGGNVPLGYDASERTLVINPTEAETVRRIFVLYRELGSVRRVKDEADRLGLRTKRGTTANGAERGGKLFSRGHIYRLLSNPIYTGQIAHKGELYPGQHPALIDAETWNAVQDQLGVNRNRHRSRSNAAEPSLLAGLVADARGERLTPSHAVKKGRRYRYYVSAALISESETDRAPGLRLAATELDDAVIRILLDTFANPAKLLELFGTADMPAEQVRKLLGRAKRLAAMLNSSPGKRAMVVRDLVEKVIIAEDEMSIRMRRAPLLARDVRSFASETPTDTAIELTAAVEFKRRGAENRLVLPGVDIRRTTRTRHDPALIKAIARGRAWFEELASGRARSLHELAKRDRHKPALHSAPRQSRVFEPQARRSDAAGPPARRACRVGRGGAYRPASARSLKRLVQFSRKPLSCVGRADWRRLGFLRHPMVLSRFPRYRRRVFRRANLSALPSSTHQAFIT